MQVDVEHEEPGAAEVVEVDGPRLVQHLDAVGGPPFVVRADLAVVLVQARLADLGADDPADALASDQKSTPSTPLVFVLQLDAFGDDVAVAEPGGFLVDVVGAAAGLAGSIGQARVTGTPPGAFSGQK